MSRPIDLRTATYPALVNLRRLATATSMTLWIGTTLAVPLTFAAEAPAAIQPPEVGPAIEEVEAIQCPSAALFSLPAVAAPMRILHESQPDRSSDGVDKGSLFTDGGMGLPTAAATPAERQKLDMARAAVEAARAAGTLYMHIPETPPSTLTVEEIEAAKCDLLRAMKPLLLPLDPASCTGIETGPVQETGSQPLSPAEQAKLAGQEVEPPSGPAPVADPSSRKEVE